MTTRGYGDRWWEQTRPADLEKTNTASAAVASQTSKDSYTVKINLPLIKNKKYKFWFKYKHENPDTKEVKLSDSSPIWTETFAIPNLTKPVQNLTLTAGSQSYGVKFDIDPTAVQEDVVIFESFTSDFASQTIVYAGTSTNVSILTTGATAFSPRWVKVRSRDKWDDLNISEATAGPVTPFSADVDTTYTVANPTGTTNGAVIDPKDLSGFSVVATINWTQSADIKTAGYAIRWSTNDPSVVGATPLWEYASVSGRSTTSFTATGLIPNTTYYYQVASTTPYDVVNWTGAASGTFIASDSDGTAAGALARLRSFIAIGGASQDLFKIGTGISQSINLNTDPLVVPPLTPGTYHGIVLNKSTTNVGNNFWLTTGQFRVGNPTEFMYWNGTNLYLTGNINATGGKFTGNVQLAIPTGGTTSGTLYAGANPTSGARVRLSSEGIFAYNSTSTNNTTGLTFSLQQSTGQLDARSGTVGGWTLATTGFSSTNTKIENTGIITLGDTTGTLNSIVKLDASHPTYRLWVGSQDAQTAANNHFAVTKEGKLYASGAQISGQLVISSGSTYDSIVLASSTATSASNTATAASNTATAASSAASTAQSRADTAYDKAVAAETGVTLAQQRAQEAKDLAALKMAAGDINTVLAYNTTVINGDRITTGTIDVARLNITGGNTTNGFAIDGNGIRGYSGGSQNLSISSTGTISMKGAITATSGKIAGFNISSVSDLYADTSVGPRILFQNPSNDTIMHFGWESGSYSTGTYAFIAGQDTTVPGSSFYVNTKTKTFRFAADSSQRSYAAEIRNDIRARDYRYIAGGGLVNDTSSRRFKENITYAPKSYYDRVLDINPAFYTYKHNHPETDSSVWGQHGFGPIVEDLEDAGLGIFVQRNLNGEPTSLKNEQKIPMLLIPIVRELKEKVEAMEQKILELEAR
jgi:hypothetical protein